jgi:Na+/melibiose symporter-like transporter
MKQSEEESQKLLRSTLDILKNEKILIKGDDLNKGNIFSYGIGHVLNDLTAACWFSFILYYLTDIVQVSKTKAGLVMLSGQLADALATPLVGIFSDKTQSKFGKRTPWYVGGTVLVVLSFSLIFQKCPFTSENKFTKEMLELMYYISLPCLFNIGWASVQVSHMSLLPSISINRKNKDLMVRLRTAFTFVAQLSCLFLSFIIFYFVEDKFLQYSVLSLSCVFIGILTSFGFCFGCPEVALSKNIDKYYEEMKQKLQSENQVANYETIPPIMAPNASDYGVKYWLSKPLFYQYIIIYMLVRISINVTCSMLPYYMESVLGIQKTSFGGTPIEISLIYLCSTSGCLFNSLLIQQKFEKLNCRHSLILISFTFVAVGCLPILFLNNSLRNLIYPLGFIFGIGFSLALSTASSLINDVVGSKGNYGAFVYGAYSFTDKLSCGILLYIFVEYVKDDKLILKFIIPVLPVFCMLLSIFLVKKKKNSNEKNAKNSEENKSIIDNSKFSFISI